MNLRKNLGSYPGILIILSLTIAMFFIGFSGWLALGSKEFVKYVKQNLQVQVFLENNLNQEQKSIILEQIKSLNVCDINATQQGVRFITKDEAAKIFYQETQEDYKKILNENPFFDSFQLKIKEDYIDEANLYNIKSHLQKIKGVNEVDFPKDFLKGVIKNVNRLYKVLSTFVFVFFLTTLLLINNTIKLALYSQRFIIRTMQLVGATDFFIQKPFLVRGIIQGVVASILSVIFLAMFNIVTLSQIEGLSLLQSQQNLYILYGVLLVLGPIVGGLSTYQSIIRYHNIDLENLY